MTINIDMVRFATVVKCLIGLFIIISGLKEGSGTLAVVGAMWLLLSLQIWGIKEYLYLRDSDDT